MTLALVLTSCSQVIKKPVLHDYALSNFEDVQFNDGVITAKLAVTLDLENPASMKYFAESLKVVLYKPNGTVFGNASLREPVAIPKRTRQRVVLPLEVVIETNPLVMAFSMYTNKSLDIESMLMDLDGVVGAANIHKKIHIEQKSVKDLLDSMKDEDPQK